MFAALCPASAIDMQQNITRSEKKKMDHMNPFLDAEYGKFMAKKERIRSNSSLDNIIQSTANTTTRYNKLSTRYANYHILIQ